MLVGLLFESYREQVRVLHNESQADRPAGEAAHIRAVTPKHDSFDFVADNLGTGIEGVAGDRSAGGILYLDAHEAAW